MNSKSKYAVLIQARMGSSRLPGKVLMSLGEHSSLELQILRLKKAGLPIIIATTELPGDKPIVEFAKKLDLPFYCGSEHNVLERYYDCAKSFGIETVIRVTSDCPLIDADLINKGLKRYYEINSASLYLSNTISRTYPRGFDFEIFSFDLLENAFKYATDDMDLEHVTPYIWKNKSGNVLIEQVVNEFNNSNFRVTLDTKEDLELISKLVCQYDAGTLPGDAIIKILDSNPQLAAINSHIEQKKI